MRIINDLKQARAKAIVQLQELQSKTAAGPLDSDQQTKYQNLKAAIEDYNEKIADAKKYQNEEDDGYKDVQNREKERPLEMYIRYGISDGLSRGSMDLNKAAAQMGIRLSAQERSDFAPLVPEEYETAVVKKAKENSILMKLARVVPMGSATKDIPVDSTDTVAYFRGESGSYTNSKADIDKKVLKAYNLYALTKLSNELIEDSAINVEQYTAENQGAVIGEKIDSTFFSNVASVSGVSPKGLFDDMTKKATIGEKLTYKDVLKMYMDIKQSYRRVGVWVASSDFITDVMGLVDEVGRPIFTPGFEKGQPDRLMGKEIYESSLFGKVTVGGGEKDALAVFGDWSKVAYGNRRGLTMKRLVELYAGNGQIGLLTDMRLDACVTLTEAIKVLHKK